MNLRDRLKNARLLLVTDPRRDLETRIAAGIRGGVDVVQLRDKHASREELLPLAKKLRGICERAGAILTVNDDIELARLSGAHGVHLGQEDEPVINAREILGPQAIVGCSAGTVGEALEAIREGADYLGVGTVYATPTKSDAVVTGLGPVRELARLNVPVPWFVIGGITLETAREAAEAGAPRFAVVRAVLDAEDPESAARKLRSFLPDASSDRVPV